MSGLSNVVGAVNDVLWSYVLIIMLVGLGIWFTIRTGCVQLRRLPEMSRLLTEGASAAAKEGHISTFQAFCVSTASRVGVGNIAGIAIAVVTGGPGAVFWMWVIACFGAATGFIESTLAQIYKEPRAKGGFVGGPAYYIRNVLGSPFWAGVFAVLISVTYGLIFNSVQANTIALSVQTSFGAPTWAVGLIVAVLTALVVFGGLTRIAKVAGYMVPVMAGAYLLVAFVVTVMNITLVPEVLVTIVKCAFDFDAVMGAGFGMAIMTGIKRGLFSNEAGMGSVPNAAATADASHPVKQGLVQAFSVYIDTLFVCSATGFMVLMTGCYNIMGPDGKFIYEGLKGVEAGPVYTQQAIDQLMPGWGGPFIAITIFFFAFTTILGYYYMAETNMAYINRVIRKPFLMTVLKAIFLGTVTFGALKASTLIWTMADVGVGTMAWLNVIAILLLQGPAFRALKDYEEQRRQGLNPVFHPEKLQIKHADYWLGEQAEANIHVESEKGVDNLAGLSSTDPK